MHGQQEILHEQLSLIKPLMHIECDWLLLSAHFLRMHNLLGHHLKGGLLLRR